MDKKDITEEDKKYMLAHEYDGIQETDYPMPFWMWGIFYACIIFALIYALHYLSGAGESVEEAYTRKWAKLEKLREDVKKNAVIDVEKIKAFLADEIAINEGKIDYMQKCAACHASQGQGLVGPNLTDKYWIHGGTLESIAKVIRNGVVEKGMLAWGDSLSEEQIYKLTAYIKTLEGSNPHNAKDPEGELYTGE